MKLFHQLILGLVLILALMGSLASAQPLEDSEADESLIGDSESADSVPDDVQQDYLNVANYVTPSPPWWWN
ncbi:uncharacterized protein LOC108105441 [Drosophila eugracilis]|uniref:uncharacterized protein LOC108105441 n=1 Tax=Drosophila eugracilis TaxID=29029 RepID=UPI0007E5D4A6|nr:uncharacterized protein LOC108105441 [Drosophila eugracilis]